MRNIIRNKIFTLLNQIKNGALIIEDRGQQFYFGDQSETSPCIRLIIHDPRVYALLLWRGINGFGDAYVAGYCQCDDLSGLFDLVFINVTLLKKIDNFWVDIFNFISAFKYLLTPNNMNRARTHIQKHYDLSNDFFEQFLDESMMYSCAYFDNNHTTLAQASINKLKLICDKLQLQPNEAVLEIGTGWGGFAVFAAQNYGCNVTTTTISKKQYHYTQALIKKLNLEKKITLLDLDYRLLSGSFDKIVSIEMIEAVGYQYFPDYFKSINQLLKPGGQVLIQAITINDKDYHRAKYQRDFIQKYIFPGGCLPSAHEINRCIQKYTQLKSINTHDITLHYVTTLQLWRKKFDERIAQIQALGFDEQFIRIWRYYFSYCEIGFLHHHIQVIQLLFHKPFSKNTPC